MKRKLSPVLAGILIAASLTACGTDPEITQFKQEMDDFCASVAQLDESINDIDAEADNAVELALDYLDQLDQCFQDLADMDFPKEFDYMEPLADEAGQYMKEAVESYHAAYADDGYDEETAAYARENSARAFKRVQVMLDILHGDYSAETVSDGDTDADGAADADGDADADGAADANVDADADVN